MATREELYNERLRKLEGLKANGGDPFPADVVYTHTGAQFIEAHDALTASAETVTLVGRIMGKRGQGKLAFLDIFDGTTKVQAIAKSPESDEALLYIESFVDSGDIIAVQGVAITSKTGQPSLLATTIRIATKSLLPLPDKWKGLQDEELKMRYRYLDMLMNDDVRSLVYLRAKFWSTLRNFLEERGFVAVETPSLEVTTGGAEAAPFATHHNDFDMDVYLRISAGELWQKRLMAAGIPKTYEIARVYRNEGSSPNHLQEFTNCEFYWSFATVDQGMQLVTDAYRMLVRTLTGGSTFTTRGHTIDLDVPWVKIEYIDEIQKQLGIDVRTATVPELTEILAKNHITSDALTRERMIDSLWKYCRKSISGPAFVVGYPDFMQPLAKRDPAHPSQVLQFQVLLGGAEVGKGYSELNDPIDQRARFEHQQTLLASGDKEAMMPDWDFVEMLEHGMPPTVGFGFGERLIAFILDKPIREVQLFPLVKPKVG